MAIRTLAHPARLFNPILKWPKGPKFNTLSHSD
jgi:hypothetical protein